MIEIKCFGVKNSQFHGKEEELIQDEGFQKLKLIYDYLKEHGKCHVRVNGGDYDGSIALFTLDDYELNPLYKTGYNLRESWFNVLYSFYGKLSWKGKRNNPMFTLMSSRCDVLLDYEGDTTLKKFDIKKEKEKLLQEEEIDIDGNVINIGDKVLYMNLRYGQGGSLCHGTVKEFKAHARQGYVSVIVQRDGSDELSECHQPWNQIYKKKDLEND